MKAALGPSLVDGNSVDGSLGVGSVDNLSLSNDLGTSDDTAKMDAFLAQTKAQEAQGRPGSRERGGTPLR